MRVRQLGVIYGSPLFIDEYMDDNRFMVGRKGSELGQPRQEKKFIIANEKTANLVLYLYKVKNREKKLERILGNSNENVGLNHNVLNNFLKQIEKINKMLDYF